jgi:MYXO-CTERM domain-containing protein
MHRPRRGFNAPLALLWGALLAGSPIHATALTYTLYAEADGAFSGDNQSERGGAGGTPGLTSVAAQSIDSRALSAADLATGTLAASATGASGVGTRIVSTTASFSDLVTVVVPGGYMGSTIPVTVGLVITGALAGGGDSSNFARILATLSVDVLSGNAQYCTTTAGSPLSCLGPPYDSNPSLTRTFDLPVGAPSFTLTGILQADAYGNAVADAYDTGLLSLTLPAGFGFSSDSGVLLSATPEPDAQAAAGLAWVALAWAAWVRRRRV